jgi:hypothetical protein
MTAAVSIQFCFGRHPARIPDRVTIFNIVVMSIGIERYIIITVSGQAGCVMYAKRTIFDLVLPRIMADDKVTAEELAALGEGGLCLNCDHCIYPNCGFGKGW